MSRAFEIPAHKKNRVLEAAAESTRRDDQEQSPIPSTNGRADLALIHTDISDRQMIH